MEEEQIPEQLQGTWSYHLAGGSRHRVFLFWICVVDSNWTIILCPVLCYAAVWF